MRPVIRICLLIVLNDFKVSDSNWRHHDKSTCAASVVVVYTLQLQQNSILWSRGGRNAHIFCHKST